MLAEDNVALSGGQMAMPRIRVAAIIRDGASILLVRHVKDANTYWLLPGGGVEYGETLKDALKREVLEETGFEARVHDLVLVNDSISPEGTRHIVNLFFTCDIVGGELRVSEDERVVEARYVIVSELSSLRFYPDIAGELMVRFKKGFQGPKSYLGALWSD